MRASSFFGPGVPERPEETEEALFRAPRVVAVSWPCGGEGGGIAPQLARGQGRTTVLYTCARTTSKQEA